MSQQGKVDRQAGYVLHAQPYRETSLLLEIFTPNHGRLTLVARGARRPRADVRGILLPFQPLTLAWFGKTEVRTLHTAEWNGGVPQLSGLRLVCGFYLNELMMKLTARDDPEPRAYAVYDEAVRALAAGKPLSAVLRRYELRLMQTLGYAPSFGRDAEGEAVLAEEDYLCRPGEFPQRDQGFDGDGLRLAGRSLLAIEADDYAEPATRREARLLTRMLLNGLLGETPLASRELLQAIQAIAD
ncbi:DNA repair protein RecO [uncultured Aquitalea sp.]|uniref:DNA repair protein RecO n=1 Tax=uncultured Aquitalea sp. TaxID=540272 RepID=UPI0025EC6539|nr:DNA repair protein RecO [uncultured Aquitalea sp.]